MVVHQVLHYLAEPAAAVAEAARLVAPGGRLLIVDFAPHGLEFLRDEHQHRRLGFSDDEMERWLAAGGPWRRSSAVTLPPAATGGLTVKIWARAHAAEQRIAGAPHETRPTSVSPPWAPSPAPAGAGRHARRAISFEFSPPGDAGVRGDRCGRRSAGLSRCSPEFVSVTYGAGGSTRERTHRTVRRILEETALTPAAHLTCVDASRGEVDEVIRDYWDAGVRHIVALRGDPPGQIGGVYSRGADGYANATELTAGIRAHRAVRGLRGRLSADAPGERRRSTTTSTC